MLAWQRFLSWPFPFQFQQHCIASQRDKRNIFTIRLTVQPIFLFSVSSPFMQSLRKQNSVETYICKKSSFKIKLKPFILSLVSLDQTTVNLSLSIKKCLCWDLNAMRMQCVTFYTSASENRHLKWLLLHFLQESEQKQGNGFHKFSSPAWCWHAERHNTSHLD